MAAVTIGSKTHIRELDGIRGAAVLMVLIWHYITCQGASAYAPILALATRPTTLFWSGVDLFFVLSGLLIGGILLDHNQKSSFYQAFYIRRAARILPAYALLISLFFLCRATLDANRYQWLFNDSIPDLAYLSFTQNIFMGLRDTFGGHFLGITWSLAVEEQFYLAMPLLLLAVGTQRFKQVVVVLTLAAPFLRLAVPGFFSEVNTLFRMDSLLAGILLAIAFRSEATVCFFSRYKSLLWSVFAVLLLGMGAMTLRGVGRSFLDPSAIALFYTVFIALALLHRDDSVMAILRSRFFTGLGMYSYGIYMYHQMVAGLLHGYFRRSSPTMATTDGIVVTAASFIVSVSLAVISFHAFEAHFLCAAKRFKYDSGGPGGVRNHSCREA